MEQLYSWAVTRTVIRGLWKLVQQDNRCFSIVNKNAGLCSKRPMTQTAARCSVIQGADGETTASFGG